ncbi:MAG: N-acetyl-gamma-glutamyl-phosphate reductase [Gammaproteobacteria bacterium TMED182]|nr:N-acetyl-gamma-glutamyl-phosphate reductase [Gammaproteobacteria bacterium]RPG57231.1 MAG: N-acetyl-gamma-glutamyl-phosphate reductase [Gammaproteobacteria bacterium TMED182]
MYKIFIDGQNGTTGLQIQQRLTLHDGVSLIELSDHERKNEDAKRAALADSDLAILCLPDEAARETVGLSTATRIIDASTAHRTHPEWIYGLPEITRDQRQRIQDAQFVSNPGCYPTGFILLLKPLIEFGLLNPDVPVFASALSGYSGGGKSMIQTYQNGDQTAVRPYGLSLNHKHVPEMQRYSGLNQDPIFLPHVGDFYQGMLVEIGLNAQHFTQKLDPNRISGCWDSYFKEEANIQVLDANPVHKLSDNFLEPEGCNGSNRVELFVFGHSEQVVLIARLDNLGKGAAGAAVQNMNLMLGLPEASGL